MDNGMLQLYFMIKSFLSTGKVWWKLPMVLAMAYSFFERERILNNALFDSYPNPLPKVKRRCNDPVLGNGYIGCYDAPTLNEYGFQQQDIGPVTPENCVDKCRTNLFVYAALHKGKYCLCGMSYKFESKVKECHCRRKCEGDQKDRCGGKNHASIFNTYFCTEMMKASRTIEGTCNDLNNTVAGSRFYRFGRNMPLQYTYVDEARLLTPNPRTLSRKLLQRKQFLQVPWLNMLAVGWVQFMVHDWFDHGSTVGEDKINIPLERSDPLYKTLKGQMKVRRTRPDSCRSDSDIRPDAYQNHVTHWWDGSQIYGSDVETYMKVRAFSQGKLKVDDDGLLPLDPKTNIDVTGFSKNWWVGLSILHNLFTREHNSICEMLLKNHPGWTDEKLFQTARLINTALLIKIHTLEWTRAILNTDYIHESLVAQWYGKLSPRVLKWLYDNKIQLGNNSFPVSIGSPPDYRGVSFSLTEEFVSVYRMHSLLPDTLKIRRMPKGDLTGKTYSLPKYSFGNARKVFDQNKLSDVIFTFGVEKAGQLVLHNYPETLMALNIPIHQQGGFVDMATIDILRDRERGVPRYNQFRRLLNLSVPDTFLKLTNDSVTAAELSEAYNGDIESVDLLIGSLAEKRPEGFGFGDTPFHLFLCMANRRLMTDRFLTIDFKEEYYTQAGLDWIDNSTMKDVLVRNFPEVSGLANAMSDITNAFYLWNVE